MEIFQEDSNDFTFATGNVCRKRLSRGRSGTSLGSLSNGPMKNHLKCHYIEWAHYTDGKKSKSVPNQYLTPILKESPTSTKQTEDKP